MPERRCVGRRRGRGALRVAIADRAPGGGPVVALEAGQARERTANVGGVETRDRIGVAIGARLHFRSDLGERAYGRQPVAALRERGGAGEGEGDDGEREDQAGNDGGHG